MRRRAFSLILLVGLLAGGCDWILGSSRAFKIKRGLETAIERGVSPFHWSAVVGSGVTEICYFGPYDDGEGLDLKLYRDTSWALVAFDGDTEVARILGSEIDFQLIEHNARGCFTPDARIEIVDRAGRALRFEDRRDYRPRK